jgi:decaprenylphospho-beta-D-erythro-pentofuranosid-2-ulose 2-reductase
MKAVLFGASKGMGRAMARLMAARGDRLFLLEHVAEELELSARDLEVRGAPKPVKSAHCDLLQPATFAPALDEAQRELGGIDAVVVTAGLYATQEDLENDSDLAARLLAADFTNTVLFCEEARKRLLGGTLCVFSSVAGERGRKPVVLYGAAKAGLSRYLEGLDHKFRARGLRTVCVKPGFVKTGMTVGLKPPPFAGTPDEVARRVLKAIDRGWPEVYVPWPWRFVMCVIRNLPRWVMRKIEF